MKKNLISFAALVFCAATLSGCCGHPPCGGGSSGGGSILTMATPVHSQSVLNNQPA